MLWGMDVIYADEILFRNAVLDAALLLLTARLLGRRVLPLRLLGAGALGGGYALLCALPPLGWLGSLPTAAGVSALLCLTAFGTDGFGRCWGVFLALAAAVAGAVMGLGRLLDENGSIRSASPRLVWLCFALCYGLLRFFFLGFWRERGRRTSAVRIRLGERETELRALRDTGNSLTDPLTGAPVLVADPSALSPLFSPPLPELPADGTEAFRRLSGRGELRGRLRLVPFSAVGTRRGMLPAFRADRVTVDGQETGHLIALSPTAVGNGEYRAII